MTEQMTWDDFKELITQLQAEERRKMEAIKQFWQKHRNYNLRFLRGERRTKIHGHRSIYSKSRIRTIVITNAHNFNQ